MKDSTIHLPMEVTVSHEHLTVGCQQDPEHCAIAIALLERGYEDVYVEEDQTSFFDGDEFVTYRHAAELTDWVRQFDSGEGAPPIRLQLDEDGDGQLWAWITPAS